MSPRCPREDDDDDETTHHDADAAAPTTRPTALTAMNAAAPSRPRSRMSTDATRRGLARGLMRIDYNKLVGEDGFQGRERVRL